MRIWISAYVNKYSLIVQNLYVSATDFWKDIHDDRSSFDVHGWTMTLLSKENVFPPHVQYYIVPCAWLPGKRVFGLAGLWQRWGEHPK